MSLLRKYRWPGAAIAAVAAIAVLLVVVVFPAGSDSPEAAVMGEVDGKAEAGTARVLVEQPWGDGALVSVRYDRDGARHLGLAFVDQGSRGWRVAAYTEERADTDDVVVASLLVADSIGGEGQPPWSAVVGELSDARIEKVEIKWKGGTTTTGERHNDGYLVVIEGEVEPDLARYLAKDGTEIAQVPIKGAAAAAATATPAA